MKRPESIATDPAALQRLRTLASQGESLHLEFKRKAAFPDKICREVIAFANTGGGTLLVGVDDNGTLAGVRFPEEESLVIRNAMRKHCRPGVVYHEHVHALSPKKFILEWTIPKSERRPHFFVADGQRTAFVRQADKSITASHELTEVIRLSRSVHGTHVKYGAAEEKILKFLSQQVSATFPEMVQASGLNRSQTSRKVIELAAAQLLRITPTEKGDLYSLLPGW